MNNKIRITLTASTAELAKTLNVLEYHQLAAVVKKLSPSTARKMAALTEIKASGGNTAQDTKLTVALSALELTPAIGSYMNYAGLLYILRQVFKNEKPMLKYDNFKNPSDALTDKIDDFYEQTRSEIKFVTELEKLEYDTRFFIRRGIIGAKFMRTASHAESLNNISESFDIVLGDLKRVQYLIQYRSRGGEDTHIGYARADKIIRDSIEIIKTQLI